MLLVARGASSAQRQQNSLLDMRHQTRNVNRIRICSMCVTFFVVRVRVNKKNPSRRSKEAKNMEIVITKERKNKHMFVRYSGHLNIAICTNKPPASCEPVASGSLFAISQEACRVTAKVQFFLSYYFIKSPQVLHPKSRFICPGRRLFRSLAWTMPWWFVLVYITLHRMCYYNWKWTSSRENMALL